MLQDIISASASFVAVKQVPERNRFISSVLWFENCHKGSTADRIVINILVFIPVRLC